MRSCIVGHFIFFGTNSHWKKTVDHFPWQKLIPWNFGSERDQQKSTEKILWWRDLYTFKPESFKRANITPTKKQQIINFQVCQTALKKSIPMSFLSAAQQERQTPFFCFPVAWNDSDGCTAARLMIARQVGWMDWVKVPTTPTNGRSQHVLLVGGLNQP